MLDSSVITLVLRLVVSLAIVIGVMFLVAGTLRKRGIVVGNGSTSKMGRGRRTPFDLEVVARRPLGRNAQLAVVRTAGKTLVLGITEHQVTMLAEADPIFGEFETIQVNDYSGDFVEQTTEAQRTVLSGTANGGSFPTWKTLLEGVRDRTVRH